MNQYDVNQVHVRNIRTTSFQGYFLAQHKDEEKLLKLNQQKPPLLKKVDEITSKSDQLDKIHVSLETNYVKFVEMAEGKMDLSNVSKANALKRKAVDVKNDVDIKNDLKKME